MSLPVHAPEAFAVLYTTCCLLRNYADMPFVSHLDAAGRQEVLRRVYDVLSEEEAVYDLVDTRKTDPDMLAALSARHLLPPRRKTDHLISFIDREEKTSVSLFSDEQIAVLGLLPGLRTIGTFQLAFQLERRLCCEYSYAFDPQWGYLTASMHTLGTGLKCRTAVHLPALQETKQISDAVKRAEAEKLSLRPLYRWTGKPLYAGAPGAFYTVENMTTLGKSETEIREALQTFVMELIDEERVARYLKRSSDALALEDRLMRTRGLLREARIMTADDLIGCLSDMRYAVSEELLPGSLSQIDRLMTLTRPDAVCATAQKHMNARECDIFRAEYVRETLKNTLTE